jgi:hypothetical protein
VRPDRFERGGFNRGQILLRSGTGASLGNVTGQYQPFGPDAEIRRNDRGALQDYRQEQRRLNRERLRIDQPGAYSRHVLADRRDGQGQRLRIEISPLRGLVTERQRADSGEGRALGASDAEGRGEDDALYDGFERPGPRPEAPSAGDADGDEPLTAAEQRRAAMRATTAQYLEPRRLGLTERLGAQLATGRPIEPIRAELPSIDRSVDRALTMTPPAETAADDAEGEADEAVAPPADPYERLLWQIRQRYGVPGDEEGEGEGGEGGPDEAGETGDGDPDGGERPADKALGRLDYDLPPVQSLSGATDKRVRQTMSEAEQQMADGRYLDAANTYEQALVLRGGYPPARVGRAHAYLGAGLFASAGRILRQTLHDHPELIAARYGQPLLPGEERLAKLRRKLTERAEAFEQDVAAPLLLAYLAYQQNDEQALNKQLSHLNQRAQGDTLTVLLRRIWMDADSPSKNEPTQ